MTEILTTPIKSSNDKNNYRLIKLQNGLKVLLVQHPKEDESSESSTKLAALNLNIDVGAYDDPQEAKGLSHFLEHCAFMGSSKYPKENEYHHFIAHNGGSLNASTSFNETSYYFTIIEKELEGAIDRFSSIFISPLFSENSIDRELESIESEFQSRKNNDSIRTQQIFYSMVKFDPAANVFVPGNRTTFRKNNRTNSELNVLLHEHFRSFYVANRMTMAIQSSLDLNEIQLMVEKYFSDIKSGTARGETAENTYKNLFDPDKFEKILYIKPKTDQKLLTITFPLPPTYRYYKTNPIDYLTKLLDEKFAGSLNNYLKKNLLITGMYGIENSQFGEKVIATVFQVKFMMTEYGSNHVEDILKAFFSYLSLIKETPIEKHKEIYEVWKTIKDKAFEFSEIFEAESHVNYVTSYMNLNDDIDILRGSKLYLKFDENVIKMYIDLLNEPNFNILIMDYQLDLDYNEVEEYFGTKYRFEDMPEKYKKLWIERESISDLKLPSKNEFICTNFEIYSIKENATSTKHPEKIFENEVAETWYKLDSKFKLPRAEVNICLISPFNFSSSFNFVLSELYELILNRFLDEKFSSAGDAGLNFDISTNHRKHLIVNFTGYNEKLHKLIDMTTLELKKFNEYVDESVFDIYKKKLMDDYKNKLLKGNFAYTMSNYLSLSNYAHDYEYYQNLQNVTIEHLEKFVEKFFKKLKIKILIQGNFSYDEAMSISNTIINNIETEPITDISTIENKVLKIPEGRRAIKIKSYQSDDKNSLVLEYYSAGERSLRKDCLLDMLESIMEEPTFDILRTKEQLGYMVTVSSKETPSSLGLYFALRSQENLHSARSVSSRISQFVKVDMKEILENLTNENFIKIKNSLINSALKPYNDLSDETSFYWREIVTDYYFFDRNEKEAEMYRKLTKQDVIDFYNEIFVVNKHKNLSIQCVGYANELNEGEKNENNDDLSFKYINEQEDDEDEIITNVEEFKASLEEYPSFKLTYNYE